MSYLVGSLPGKKKELNGESKGGLDPKKGKRKRKGKEGFLSYHVISMRGWGWGFPCFLPQTSTPSHAQRKRKRRGGEEEEGGGGDD